MLTDCCHTLRKPPISDLSPDEATTPVFGRFQGSRTGRFKKPPAPTLPQSPQHRFYRGDLRLDPLLQRKGHGRFRGIANSRVM
jgi:hypothetical protein